jgi:hypothetical protein
MKHHVFCIFAYIPELGQLVPEKIKNSQQGMNKKYHNT